MLRRQPGFGQLGIEIGIAAITQSNQHDTRQAALLQPEHFVEPGLIETFHRAGVDTERSCALKQGTQRQVDLLFDPDTDVLQFIPMQIDVEAAGVISTLSDSALV